MFSYSTGYYVSLPDDQYLKFKNRCSLRIRYVRIISERQCDMFHWNTVCTQYVFELAVQRRNERSKLLQCFALQNHL